MDSLALYRQRKELFESIGIKTSSRGQFMNAATVISGLLAHTALVFLILANELDSTRSRITTFVPKPSVRLVSCLFACSLYIISVSLTSHIDEKCTSSQRRRQAGHGSDSVYD